jgi:dynein heavy chain
MFLADMDIQEDLRPLILDHIVMVHMSVCKLSIKFTQQTQRTNYVTPKNFLDYILTYRTSLKTKRIQNSEQAKRLDGGLQKLIQAKVEVSTLQVILFIFIFLYLFGCYYCLISVCGWVHITLAEAKIVVDAKTKQCNELIDVIRY